MKTYGRTTIYTNYTEEQVLSLDGDDLNKVIIDILRNSLPIHEKNKAECIYLKKFLIGKQDIYVDKKKVTRPEINNKTVENWAYAMIDFKKCWLLGKPIQYVLLNEEKANEISTLNNFCRFENKRAKDMLLYEDCLCCGRGYRYTAPNGKFEEDDESPFEITNVDPSECEIVYESALGHNQVLSYIEKSKRYINSNNKNTPYNEYTVYLRNKQLIVNDKSGQLTVVGLKPLILNKHYITESYLNEERIGLIELGKDLFNDINYLESLDKDDMEQFVNAIMVFTNADFDEEELAKIKKLGAVKISSNDGRQASVSLLSNRLNAESTQTYYSRLVSALHQILGIPKADDSGDVSYGDTGQARLTGQGYTSAGIRAAGDEVMFAMCDRNSLRTILAICKEKDSGIRDLKLSAIDSNFQRDMSDGMLTKSQTLKNLYDCNIPKKFANAIVGLFGDPNAVTEEQNRQDDEKEKEAEKVKETNVSSNLVENDQIENNNNQQLLNTVVE